VNAVTETQRPLVPIELVARESVVAHGTERVSWWIFDGQHWISVRDYEGCTLTRANAGPGVVWETLASVSVPKRTWVMRVRSRPRTTEPLDPLRYLERGVLQQRLELRRTFFCVDEAGRLRPPAAGEEPPIGEWLPLENPGR
jgi:hypothetical protein